ncbi:MAG: hypothetical protein Q9164_001964 [Protoblastenia rupestris]
MMTDNIDKTLAEVNDLLILREQMCSLQIDTSHIDQIIACAFEPGDNTIYEATIQRAQKMLELRKRMNDGGITTVAIDAAIGGLFMVSPPSKPRCGLSLNDSEPAPALATPAPSPLTSAFTTIGFVSAPPFATEVVTQTPPMLLSAEGKSELVESATNSSGGAKTNLPSDEIRPSATAEQLLKHTKPSSPLELMDLSEIPRGILIRQGTPVDASQRMAENTSSTSAQMVRHEEVVGQELLKGPEPTLQYWVRLRYSERKHRSRNGLL